jgi:hypothetical protein
MADSQSRVDEQPRVIYSPVFGLGIEMPDGEQRFAPPRVVCMNTLHTALREEVQGNRATRRANRSK